MGERGPSEVTTARMIAFPPRPARGDPVEEEAGRRLRLIGYPRWLARSRATGSRIPPAVEYLKMQIEFTAAMLKRLDPLPEDFRSDAFWPS